MKNLEPDKKSYVNNIIIVEKLGEVYSTTFEKIYYEYNNTVYVFNEPYQLIIRKEKGDEIMPVLYCAEDESYGISVAEETLEEAIQSFHSDIDFLWRNYAIEDDEKLGKRPKMLKNNMNKLIREVIKL